jgi:hypothetical protein
MGRVLSQFLAVVRRKAMPIKAHLKIVSAVQKSSIPRPLSLINLQAMHRMSHISKYHSYNYMSTEFSQVVN